MPYSADLEHCGDRTAQDYKKFSVVSALISASIVPLSFGIVPICLASKLEVTPFSQKLNTDSYQGKINRFGTKMY